MFRPRSVLAALTLAAHTAAVCPTRSVGLTTTGGKGQIVFENCAVEQTAPTVCGNYSLGSVVDCVNGIPQDIAYLPGLTLSCAQNRVEFCGTDLVEFCCVVTGP